jgi:hypothetical protein
MATRTKKDVVITVTEFASIVVFILALMATTSKFMEGYRVLRECQLFRSLLFISQLFATPFTDKELEV